MRFRLKTHQQRIKLLSFIYSLLNEYILACENSRFSSLFATEKAVFSGLYISVRLSLSSTLKRRAFSSKTHRFEKRPWEWIKTKTHTNRISLDGRKRNKAKWKYHKRVCYSKRIVVLSFSNVLLWVVENVSKGYFERESIDAFSMTKKTHTLKTH